MSFTDKTITSPSNDADQATIPCASMGFKSNHTIISWPPVPKEDMNVVVTAFCEMSNTRVHRPLHEISEHELKEPIPHANNVLTHRELSEASVERLTQAAELAYHMSIDLSNIPVVETREELTLEKMEALAKASIRLWEQKIPEIKLLLDDFSQLCNLGGKVFQSGRETYGAEGIGQWSIDAIDVLKKYGIDLAPKDTSSKLYAKLASVWEVVEKSLIQTNLQWLQGCLETQRLKFYFEVGQHLSTEATGMIRHAEGKFRENEDSFLIADLDTVVTAPFLMQWPVCLQPLKY